MFNKRFFINKKIFYHPDKVGMTYMEHMKFSMYLSYNLSKASIASVIHAVYPDILITYSSDMINKLKGDIDRIK